MNVSKIGPEHTKRCSSIRGPRKTCFRAEIPKIYKKSDDVSLFLFDLVVNSGYVKTVVNISWIMIEGRI